MQRYNGTGSQKEWTREKNTTSRTKARPIKPSKNRFITTKETITQLDNLLTAYYTCNGLKCEPQHQHSQSTLESRTIKREQKAAKSAKHFLNFARRTSQKRIKNINKKTTNSFQETRTNQNKLNQHTSFPPNNQPRLRRKGRVDT